MLVLHVHVLGQSGAIEKTYDFIRNDGKDTFDGMDVVIPFEETHNYPLSERDAMAIISNRELMRGDH